MLTVDGFLIPYFSVPEDKVLIFIVGLGPLLYELIIKTGLCAVNNGKSQSDMGEALQRDPQRRPTLGAQDTSDSRCTWLLHF